MQNITAEKITSSICVLSELLLDELALRNGFIQIDGIPSLFENKAKYSGTDHEKMSKYMIDKVIPVIQKYIAADKATIQGEVSK